MKRASFLVATAGGMLFLMAGCAISELFVASQSDAVTGERVVVGSLGEVAATQKKVLGQLGLNAVITEVGQEVHVASQTRTGARFEFILTHVQTAQGERTRIRMHWLDSRNDEAHVQILAEMDKEHKKG